ncbi:MAG: hypothetical protein PHT38_00300 [Halothiobacillus sp.]|jgi:hypothetical protein|nr:hypothetical protein [Halothiobacillus sp.]MDY0146526.1 hypothetical protein [Halothiobacillus sp.]
MAAVKQEAKLPSSLGEANRILSNYGIPQFSESGFKKAIDELGANRLKMAIVDLQAAKNGVAQYLKNIVNKHGSLHPQHDTQSQTPIKEEHNTMDRQQLHPAQQQATNNSANSSETNRFEERESIKIFGQKAAFTIEADVTQGCFHTIAIDAASMTGPKQYDWTKKTRIQVTRAELPALLSVFLGIMPAVEYKNHGPENNKGFAFEDQGDKIFGKVFSKEGVRALPITPEDSYFMAMIMARQLAKNYPGTSLSEIIQMLRATMVRKIRTR